MIADLDTDELPQNLEADVCIIGAGAAGLAVGLGLARAGKRVVMLESGGASYEAPVHDLNRCDFGGRPYNGAHEGRFRGLGGSTTRWGGQILPFQPIDFEARPWVDGRGWPIRWSDLETAYASSYALVGLDTCLKDDAKVWASIGELVPSFGNDVILPYFSRWSPEPDMSRMHWPEIALSPHLRCVLHATVTAFVAEDTCIVEARARSLGGRRISVRARRFVVCTGGIETARLLLHPLVDGRPAPFSGADLIGRYLQDHPGLTCAEIKPATRADMHRVFDNVVHGRTRYQPRLRLADEEQRRRRMLQTSCSIIFQSRDSDIISRVKSAGSRLIRGRGHASDVRDVAAAAPLVARMGWRTLVKHRAFNPDDLGFRLAMQVEQKPDPDSRVTLTDETDATGLRRASIDWRVGPHEIEAVATMSDIVKSAFEAAGFARVEIDADVLARAPSVASRMVDQNHHIGTARMADDPRHGVVDRDLLVFGTDNLYVCGSAVFPTGSFSNPTLTILALGVRLAEKIAGDVANG